MQPPVLAIFDAKSYDREYLARAAADSLTPRFFDFRLCAETAPAAQDATAVCCFVNDPVDATVAAALKNLGVRHLALRCAGFNNIDLAALQTAGIQVTRVPSYSPHAVAEHTVALLLALNRKIHRAYSRVREMNFSLGGLVGFDLHGKTAGIIGTGKTGKLAATILRGFGMRVLASDVFPDADWAAAHGISYAETADLIAASDVISLHAPLTPDTRHIIDADAIARMKPGVVIVNVSRGRLIHTAALIAGLKSGHIGGVALDVYEEDEGVFFEDLSGVVMQDDELARLLTFPNVLVTAHQAFLTHEALTEIARVTVENTLRIAAGNAPIEGTAIPANIQK